MLRLESSGRGVSGTMTRETLNKLQYYVPRPLLSYFDAVIQTPCLTSDSHVARCSSPFPRLAPNTSRVRSALGESNERLSGR